jgi:hypothetical protein
MGIMGSFLDSYFSFDVVTDSPGAPAKQTLYWDFTLSLGSWEMAFTV